MKKKSIILTVIALAIVGAVSFTFTMCNPLGDTNDPLKDVSELKPDPGSDLETNPVYCGKTSDYLAVSEVAGVVSNVNVGNDREILIVTAKASEKYSILAATLTWGFQTGEDEPATGGVGQFNHQTAVKTLDKPSKDLRLDVPLRGSKGMVYYNIVLSVQSEDGKNRPFDAYVQGTRLIDKMEVFEYWVKSCSTEGDQQDGVEETK